MAEVQLNGTERVDLLLGSKWPVVRLNLTESVDRLLGSVLPMVQKNLEQREMTFSSGKFSLGSD